MFKATSQKPQPKGSPLPESEREALMRFVHAQGERVVLAALGINAQTLARAVGGLTIYNGSAALIRIGIGKLESQAQRLQAAQREGR